MIAAARRNGQKTQPIQSSGHCIWLCQKLAHTRGGAWIGLARLQIRQGSPVLRTH